MDSPKTPDSDPFDEPPAYDNADASSRAPPEKRPTREPVSPTASSSSTMIPRSVPVKTTWKDDMGSLLYWGLGLGTAQHRATQETVNGLVHDLVWDQTIDSNTAYLGILQSCSEICVAHSLDLSVLLQKAYIQGHTPLYWAIAKRPIDDSKPTTDMELPSLIRALLKYSAPLSESTIKDIRLACIHACDQWLFRGLQMRPEFQALSLKDQALLGVQVPPDTINIETPARHNAPFTVVFEFAEFQKRMRISQKSTLDFISHARMWQLAFYVDTDSRWFVGVFLGENSPPTYVSVKYTIEKHGPGQIPASLQASASLREQDDYRVDPYRWAPTVALPDAVMYPLVPPPNH
ncbi:hypothetical protein B0H11DRAFT_2201438 [Mycena galericulata]|nr:hypothetical protein B0H11DRAFT_2201438 [Mycena galericulata]